MARELATILGDLLRKGRCPEILVEYSCGHTVQPEVHLAPFLADKKEPRMAARALRMACRTPVVGEDGVFRIEVPGGPCQHSACASDAGRRRALRCGATSMDLLSACEAPENAIPVGIAAAQFATWVQQGSTEEVQHIPLTSCRGSQSWRQFFTTPGSLGPVLIGMLLWALGCFLYAVYTTPQIPMVTPELFYQQVQDQIENIPVPKDSPHYSHYRRYYLQQYQQHLTQYREMEEDFKLNKGPRLNWGALLQGLGIGTWFFVAVLAFCEYRYTTVTAWMEMVEEQFALWRQRWRDEDGGRGKKKPQRSKKAKEEALKEAKEVKEVKEVKEKVLEKVKSAKPKKRAEEKSLQTDRDHSAVAVEVPQAASTWRWWPFFATREAKAQPPAPSDPSHPSAPLHKEAAETTLAGESTLHSGASRETEASDVAETVVANKGLEEEPAVEPEPIEEVHPATEGGQDEVAESESSKQDQAADSEPAGSTPCGHADDQEQQAETEMKAVADDASPGSDDDSWQMVTKGRPKAAVKEKVVVPEPPVATKTVVSEPEEPVQVPKNPETLSTQELVDFLQMSSVRRQLLRRGVPIREQLLHWFRELQDPPKSSVTASRKTSFATNAPSESGGRADRSCERPKATPAPWSKLGARPVKEKISLRAEAPEFFPKDIDMEHMPAGTVLVPCVLPPGQDGSLAVPAGHVLLLGAMGLPEGVPLIVPTSETSWEQLNTQFDLVPPFELPFDTLPALPALDPEEGEDVIVDASNMNFLHVPAEDHVAAAIAAAAAAAEAEDN